MISPAPMATIPYTGPFPGVRLPNRSVSIAETNGSSATSHADRSRPGDPAAACVTTSLRATT